MKQVMATKYVIPLDDGEELSYEVESLGGGRYRVRDASGQAVEVDAYVPAAGRMHLLVGARSLEVSAQPTQRGWEVLLEGRREVVPVWTQRELMRRRASGADRGASGPSLQSPMAGKVVAVQVEAGARVSKGQVLVIVEAMKMENDLKAHRDGVVGQVQVVAGQTVEVGQVLVTIEDEA